MQLHYILIIYLIAEDNFPFSRDERIVFASTCFNYSIWCVHLCILPQFECYWGDWNALVCAMCLQRQEERVIATVRENSRSHTLTHTDSWWRANSWFRIVYWFRSERRHKPNAPKIPEMFKWFWLLCFFKHVFNSMFSFSNQETRHRKPKMGSLNVSEQVSLIAVCVSAVFILFVARTFT